jgi:hypothetical protein
MDFIEHCFICRLSDSIVSDDAGQDCCDFGIGSHLCTVRVKGLRLQEKKLELLSFHTGFIIR